MKKSSLYTSVLSIICTVLLTASQCCAWDIIQSYQFGGGGGASSSCPSFYSSSILSWDGDHDSGTNYACESDGDAVIGTIGGSLTISTTYGESSSNGAFIDAVDKYLTYSDSGDQYIDDDTAQTVWMRVYLPNTVTANTQIFEAYAATTDYIKLIIKTDNKMQGSYYANSVIDNRTKSVTPQAAWVDVAVSWDRPNGDFAVYADAEWAETLDVLVDTFTTNITQITIGEKEIGGGAPGAGNEPRVTQWAIVSGYKSSMPW